MCLVSKSETPLTSTYDILCYKILVPIGDKFLTPYRDFNFPINKVITSKDGERPFECCGFFLVSDGYFHSYKNLTAARKKVEDLKRKLPKDKIPKVFEAQIPSGTSFFEGQAEDICSKSLKIIKECLD